MIERKAHQELYDDESVHSVLVGLAADYLTRFTMESPKDIAFEISLRGAMAINELEYVIKLLDDVHGNDNKSIESIFYPRLNKIYLLGINEISDEIMSKVSTEVIGY